MKAGLLIFPGTNCDTDLMDVLTSRLHMKVEKLWHKDFFDVNHDIYFLPGGFSYGDYLRSGAMASTSRSILSLKEAAQKGRKVLGICNGFQILTESGLLPGALIKNNNLQHICRWVKLKGNGKFSFSEDYRLPVSHSEGNFICSEDTLKELQDNQQIFMNYDEPVNGSVDNIAGIFKENIYGLMPHPERAMHNDYQWDGSSRQLGAEFFEKILAS